MKKIADEYNNYLRQRDISESQENSFDLESDDKMQNIDEDSIKSNTDNSDIEIQNADNIELMKSDAVFNNISSSQSCLVINSVNFVDSADISLTAATASRVSVYQAISDTL